VDTYSPPEVRVAGSDFLLLSLKERGKKVTVCDGNFTMCESPSPQGEREKCRPGKGIARRISR